MSELGRGVLARLFGLAAVGAVVLGTAAVAPSPAAAASTAPNPLPNWTGVWEHEGTIMFDPTVQYGQREAAPLTPEYAERYNRNFAIREKGGESVDPTSKCLPPGMPRIMVMTYPMEIRMDPQQVTIIAEWDSQVRRVYTDGRQHPSGDDLEPSFNGHSIGHWEGQTLVIDTVGIRGDTTFDSGPLEHSDKIHVAERMRLVDPETLENQITVTDPVAFVKPWVVTRRYKRAPKGFEIREYVCNENNRPVFQTPAKAD